MFTDVVILAGGYGERLWPASSPSYPKQFMTVTDGISFFQAAVLRALSLKLTGKIIVVTRKELTDIISQHCSQLLDKVDDYGKQKIQNDVYILPEPEAKHTTAPIILACHFLEILFPKTKHTVLVLTSDHIITPESAFITDAEKASKAAENGKFVLYAIPPTEPNTGYGYIKTGAAIGDCIYDIENFKEKPNLETAKEYVASGNYWWNSGMFGFTTEVLKNELKLHQNDAYTVFADLPNKAKPQTDRQNGILYINSWAAMDEAYEKTPVIAIDKSVAEKTTNACAVRASFNWKDIGSWDAFADLFDHNVGKTAIINSENCFVYSDIPVALCGVKDLVVVVKNDRVLIMKKGESATVKEAVKQMKE
ncbi:MAG: mannose-1-phosphate guanylyltransferase [Treponema sp.]|nr:mannose-1-phosphate guanylyltransferase [Treponema sp.]